MNPGAVPASRMLASFRPASRLSAYAEPSKVCASIYEARGAFKANGFRA